MNSRTLTDKQEAFLLALFDPKNNGNIRKAMTAAGYAESTPEATVIEPLYDEIRTRTDKYLQAQTAKAAMKLSGILDADDKPIPKGLVNIINSILDRGGLGKKDKLEVDVNAKGGLFVLPPKAQDE